MEWNLENKLFWAGRAVSAMSFCFAVLGTGKHLEEYTLEPCLLGDQKYSPSDAPRHWPEFATTKEVKVYRDAFIVKTSISDSFISNG